MADYLPATLEWPGRGTLVWVWNSGAPDYRLDGTVRGRLSEWAVA